MDLDFSTKHIATHAAVEDALKGVCLKEHDGVIFFLKGFVPVERPDGLGASVRIGYRTNQGQSNELELDIVYALPAQMMSIPSPISEGATIVAATVENIIADKLAASHRFKGGNTRMKDFDDLWRISKSLSFPIDWQILRELLANRGISPVLDVAWINGEMEAGWSVHLARNPDLPPRLVTVMTEVNLWLNKGLFEE